MRVFPVAYAGYFREERASVTSREAPGGTKRMVRKTGPQSVQLTYRPEQDVSQTIVKSISVCSIQKLPGTPLLPPRIMVRWRGLIE